MEVIGSRLDDWAISLWGVDILLYDASRLAKNLTQPHIYVLFVYLYDVVVSHSRRFVFNLLQFIFVVGQQIMHPRPWFNDNSIILTISEHPTWFVTVCVRHRAGVVSQSSSGTGHCCRVWDGKPESQCSTIKRGKYRSPKPLMNVTHEHHLLQAMLYTKMNLFRLYVDKQKSTQSIIANFFGISGCSFDGNLL